MLDETIVILGVALVLAGICIFWLAFSLYDTQQRLVSLEGYVGAQFSILDRKVRQILEASKGSQAPRPNTQPTTQPSRHERMAMRRRDNPTPCHNPNNPFID